jgi:hypothetical protein
MLPARESARDAIHNRRGARSIPSLISVVRSSQAHRDLHVKPTERKFQ